MEIELGNYKINDAEEAPSRLAQMIWGDAGCGKTTLAATAPGKKLWVRFDDEGLASVKGLRSDITERYPDRDSALKNVILDLDLSHEKNNVIDKFKRDDGLGLGKLLADDELGIETVVVDSVTRLSQMGLEHSIAMGLTKGAKLETPGMAAYGARNAQVLRMFTDVMNVTGQYNKNVIFICHEAAPATNDDGAVQSISMMLGGQLPQLTTQRLGEVWFMKDTPKGRKIFLRPYQYFRPMKSRMFDLGGTSEIDWKYNIDDPDPEYEIATWYKRWKDGGGKKLPVPK